MTTPEERASQVLQDFWDLSIPVDPIVIARKMGVSVVYNKEIKTSGEFLFDEEGKPKIRLHPDEPPYRQRFTAAHELAHLVLGHGPRPRLDNTAYSPYNFDPIERDANIFAASLIMPRPAVEHFVDVGLGLEDIARRFNVSGRAMQVRLERMGLL